MADRAGDKSKQPPECRINDAPPHCPHIKTTSETWDGERWECRRCGERYALHYEDMQ